MLYGRMVCETGADEPAVPRPLGLRVACRVVADKPALRRIYHSKAASSGVSRAFAVALRKTTALYRASEAHDILGVVYREAVSGGDRVRDRIVAERRPMENISPAKDGFGVCAARLLLDALGIIPSAGSRCRPTITVRFPPPR